MGKMLIHQKRGKGLPAFLSPGHRFLGDVRYPDWIYSRKEPAQIVELLDDPGRNVLLAKLLFRDGKSCNAPAPEGVAIGDKIVVGEGRPSIGAILPLSAISDGMPVFNLEIIPRDGGKIARSSGAICYVVSHDEETGAVNVVLPSKKSIILSPRCYAMVGVACGGERVEKPMMKAGVNFYAMKARNKYYPKSRGSAMSAYDHPHGGKSMGTPSTVSRGAPRGAKVGLIAARQSGRKKTQRDTSGKKNA